MESLGVAGGSIVKKYGDTILISVERRRHEQIAAVWRVVQSWARVSTGNKYGVTAFP